MLLAQINVARMRAAPDSPAMGGFMAAVDPVYRLADGSAGFVWRLPGAGGHMPTCRDDADGWQVVNVSVWASYEALHDFVYRSGHGGLIRRRSAWFLPTRQPSTALWWLPDDRRPTLEQARARLALLRNEARPRGRSACGAASTRTAGRWPRGRTPPGVPAPGRCAARGSGEVPRRGTCGSIDAATLST